MFIEFHVKSQIVKQRAKMRESSMILIEHLHIKTYQVVKKRYVLTNGRGRRRILNLRTLSLTELTSSTERLLDTCKRRIGDAHKAPNNKLQYVMQ